MAQNFIVRKNGLFLKNYDLDTTMIYKITNIANNRWFIRNGHIGFFTKNKTVSNKILRITIPKFEKPFFKKDDLVKVEKFGQTTDKKTIQIFEAEQNRD